MDTVPESIDEEAEESAQAADFLTCLAALELEDAAGESCPAARRQGDRAVRAQIAERRHIRRDAIQQY